MGTGDERVTVRLFGALHTLRRERGLPATADIELPSEGKTGEEIAAELGLPLELIEAVFCNHVACDLGHVIRPGDQVAFVPRGTPGPHRFTLGIHRAGRTSRRPTG